jgi:hypothetical protein
MSDFLQFDYNARFITIEIKKASSKRESLFYLLANTTVTYLPTSSTKRIMLHV